MATENGPDAKQGPKAEEENLSGEDQPVKMSIFITKLLTEPNVRAAAKEAGISEATAYRWQRDPAFQQVYKEAKRTAVEQAMSQLQWASSRAVSTLCNIMNDNTAPAGSRVTAARTVMDTSFKSVAADDMDARIASLEQSGEEKFTAMEARLKSLEDQVLRLTPTVIAPDSD